MKLMPRACLQPMLFGCCGKPLPADYCLATEKEPSKISMPWLVVTSPNTTLLADDRSVVSNSATMSPVIRLLINDPPRSAPLISASKPGGGIALLRLKISGCDKDGARQATAAGDRKSPSLPRDLIA